MTKLDKATLKTRDEIAARLRDRRSNLDIAIEKFNIAVEAAWEPLEKAAADYNEVVEDANAWKADVARDIQSYHDDRSEKWQDGEKGQAYSEWMQAYQDEEFATADGEKPEEFELDLDDAAEILEQLPEGIDP